MTTNKSHFFWDNSETDENATVEGLKHYAEATKNTLALEQLRRGISEHSAFGPRELIARNLGSVQMRSIEWLWPGWIPKGYVTIWAGETGAGKSTVLADVTARVTTGAPWPGQPPEAQREPGLVLWLGSEDGIEELTVPRLVACGAQLENVTEIQGVVQQGKRNTFSMQDDLAAVRSWLTRPS